MCTWHALTPAAACDRAARKQSCNTAAAHKQAQGLRARRAYVHVDVSEGVLRILIRLVCRLPRTRPAHAPHTHTHPRTSTHT
jgi:hypothetical protein